MLRRWLMVIFPVLMLAPATHAAEIVVQALFRDVAVITVDGQRYQLRTGEATPEGILLLNADSEAALLSVNGREERYLLGETTSIPLGLAPAAAEVRIYPVEGMYMAPGAINGIPVQFLVDTGATYVAMNERTARKLRIDYLRVGEPGMAATANGNVRIWAVLLNRVKVGDIELSNVRGAVIEGVSPEEVLLGMSFLGRTRMLRDNGVMLLQKKW